ncbi:MAG: hemerythrin-like domain-containing protein [Bacteroidia bacterium]|jgi:hemerythrin-like domain-containing protein
MAATKTAAKPKTGAARNKAPVKKKAVAGKKAPARKRAAAKKAAPAKKGASAGKEAAASRAASTAKRAPAQRKVVAVQPAAAAKKPAHKRAEQPLMAALKAEHRHMASVMQLFAEHLNTIEKGELVDTHVVYEAMDYMVTWPDRFHHPREDLIYARVAELDGNIGDEVDTLQRDHDKTAQQGSALLESIQRWRNGELPGEELVQIGRDYIAHIHEHMNLEEKVVFPHIESVLSNQDWRELAEDDQLQAVTKSVFGPQVQREYRNLSRKLRLRVRRGVERGALMEWIGLESLMESLEVVSMAAESARDATGEHLRTALSDSWDIFFEAPARAPLRLAANNTRVTLRILSELVRVSGETVTDLTKVNQERQDRMRLLNRSN